MRIVSLCPSLTELCFQLGCGNRVVGVTKFCVHPAAEVARRPQVGGTKDPKLDAIAALRPDLVLMNEEENRREDAEALEARGLRVWSSFPRSVADAAPMVRDLGVALDAHAAAESLASEIEAALQRAEHAQVVRYACLIWRDPWMALGDETYAASLLRAVGGRNVFAGHDGYPTFRAEELGALAPERVLLPDEPFPFRARHVEELAERTGLRRETFVPCRGEPLFWHGSKTCEGLDAAAGWLAG
jgi:ABC-type hemin transport system substrate-binding protein